MSENPYIPFYPDTFLADTAMLSNEEKGVYFVLLCYLWINGGELPDDDMKVARLLGISSKKCQKMRKNLRGFFTFSDDGFFSQKRLTKELEKVQKIRQTNSENGKKGGRPKKANPAETLDNQEALAFDFDNQNRSDRISQKKPTGFISVSDALIPNDKRNQKPTETIPEPKPSHSHNQNLNKLASFKQAEMVDNPHSTCDIEQLTADICLIFTKNNVALPTDGHLLSEWLQCGADAAQDIIPTIKKIIERNTRRGTKQPKSFAYFQEAIARAVEKRTGGL